MTSKYFFFCLLIGSLVAGGLKAQQCFKLISEGKFEGLIGDSSTKQINVLIIHGTGIKPRTYANKMINYCLKNVKANEVDTILVYRSEDSLISVKKVKGRFANSRIISFYIVHWSPYTTAAKGAVRQIEKENGYYRSLVSMGLKNAVLIKEFYDFVIFSNIEFKRKMKAALNEVFGDILKNSKNTSSSLNLISGSLGSSVFVEYVNKIQANILDTTGSVSGGTKAHFKSIIDYITNNKTRFFMLTNQVNFLESIIAQKEIPTFSIDVNKMQVVAFRHTNDVLCFYLPEERAAQFVNFMPVSVTNVRYKNFPFGNFIMAAHNKPFKLKKIFGAVLYGSKYKKVKIKKKP